MKNSKLLRYGVSLLLVTMLFLTSCSQPAQEQKSSADQSQATKPSASVKTIKLGFVNPANTLVDDTAKKLGQLIEEKTQGQIKVDLFPAGQLGNNKDMAEALTIGSLELNINSTEPIAWYTPEFGAIDMPYVFRDMEHMEKVNKGKIGEDINKALIAAKGIRVLAYMPRGPRQLTAKKEVKSLDDLKGLKMRVSPIPMHLAAWKALGVESSPIAYTELYMALKQGVVDAQENPLEQIYTANLYEVQKYIMETEHVISPYTLLVSEKFFSGLSSEFQKAVMEAAAEVDKFYKEGMLKEEKEFRDKLEEKGMTFVKVDKELFSKPILEAVPKEYGKEWKPGLLEEIQSVK